MIACHRCAVGTFLICLIVSVFPAEVIAEFHGYDFNHDAAPDHQQPGYEYVDKYTRFDDAVPGSFGWRRSGITSNTHQEVAENGPPGLYELYYDSNNSWYAATFSTNLGSGSYLVTLYWGRATVGGAPFSFSVTFEDSTEVVLECGDSVACDYTRLVDVTDGTLDITFDHVDGAWWLINGIGIELEATHAPDAIQSPPPSILRVSPNPFWDRTEIHYELERPGRVLLEVFDVAGSRIVTLVNGEMEGGLHRVDWDGTTPDGRPLSNGIYYCRIEMEWLSEIGRMVLVR